MSNKAKEAFEQIQEKIVHPAVLDVEKNVLAAVMLNENSIITVVKYLKPYHFSDIKHQIIFKACLSLFDSNLLIDISAIYETLKKLEQTEKAGGLKYLNSLSVNYNSDAYLVQWCRLIYEKWMLREFISKSKAAIIKAQKEIDDPFELIGETANELDVLLNASSNDIEEKSLSERLPQIIDHIKRERLEGEAATFKSIDFPSFNIATGGIKKGNLIVISGKYKSGKTRFSLALLKDFAVNSKIPVGLIGFEMDQEEYDKNLLSMECGVRYGYLRNPGAKNKDGSFKLNDSDLIELETKANKSFGETKIFISDKSVYDSDVTAKIKFWTKKHHLKIIVIDYLQLIETNKRYERRDLELAEISKRLKNIARSENIAIIVLVQENEAGQSADSKGPLRDSDFWFSITHPVDDSAYYIDDLSNGKNAGQSKKKCVVRIKDRNGSDKMIEADQSIFHVKFKASRHSANGKSFLCKFFEDGKFIELSLDQDIFQDNLI